MYFVFVLRKKSLVSFAAISPVIKSTLLARDLSFSLIIR